MAEETKTKRKDDEVGALWTEEKESDGSKYWSGSVTFEGVEHKIVVFTNSFKVKGDKQPSLRIYKKRDLSESKKKEDTDFPD